MAKNKTPNRGPSGLGSKTGTKTGTENTNGSNPTKAPIPPLTLKPEPGKPANKSPLGSGTIKTAIKKDSDKKKEPVQFVFERQNYLWMFIGIGVLILGFFLMSGTTDIMSSTKIVLAPFIVLVGFGIEFYAILLNPTKKI
jgi:hypothetical protein